MQRFVVFRVKGSDLNIFQFWGLVFSVLGSWVWVLFGLRVV